MLYRRNRTPIALLNMLANPTRAIVSISGVIFALLLVFVQLGFRGAVANTATIVYGKLDFDVLVQSPEYLHLYEPRLIDRAWLDVLRSHPEVQSAEPFWISLNKWRSPRDGRFRAIGMMAVQAGSSPIKIDELPESIAFCARRTTSWLIELRVPITDLAKARSLAMPILVCRPNSAELPRRSLATFNSAQVWRPTELY